MKCQEFQSNVDGLARGALLDARTRDEAAAHEEACGPCAARLADERALTAGLRALAASMREASAPARAEDALLTAFRSRAAYTSSAAPTAAESSTTAAHANVVSISERAGERHWSWVKTVAVAAMAAAAAVALFMLVPPSLPGPVPARQSASNKAQGATTQTQNNSTSNETAQVNGVRGAASSGASEGSGGATSTESKVNVEDEPSRALTPRRGVVRGMNASYAGTSRGVASNRGASEETANAGEITTEFIPLVDAGFGQSEGAHLVRVELPRSALASFGIPVNAEQAGGRVKADVLLGEDGTARAIRFVR